MNKLRTLVLSCLIASTAMGQNEFNNWFFGVGNGLNFSTPTPTLITGSPINQTEGVAAISDASGNLLFYTSGVNVYDRNHNIMLNGSGLLGDISSTQSAVIVQKPLSTNIFYIFTSDADIGTDGIRWSEVDINLNGGLGAVTANKNILLQSLSCEKLCAVRHCNGRDIWVISHDWNASTFRTWLVTSAGISAPILSSAGYVPTAVNQIAYGQLKSNRTGNKLAAAYFGLTGQTAGNRVEVYDFNNTTGIVSNVLSLGNVNGAYGVEFSNSGKYLYCATNQGQLYQWDLCAASVSGSKFLLSNMGAFGGSLQIAPNGKIYIARGTNTFLSSISFPEVYGFGCFFTNFAINLNGFSRFGLPNFPSYYQPPTPPTINITQNGCNNFCLSYNPQQSCINQSVSYKWVFNDGQIIQNQTACKSITSTQNVLLLSTYPCTTDTTIVNLSFNSGISTILIIN